MQTPRVESASVFLCLNIVEKCQKVVYTTFISVRSKWNKQGGKTGDKSEETLGG